MSSSWTNYLIVAGYWLAVFLWMIVIYVFSAQAYSGEITQRYLGGANIPVRKLAHMLEYAILFCLSFRALNETDKRIWHCQRRGLLTLVMCIVYALSDEWHQSFVPGRSALLSDVAVDTYGALVAFGCLRWLSALNER